MNPRPSPLWSGYQGGACGICWFYQAEPPGQCDGLLRWEISLINLGISGLNSALREFFAIIRINYREFFLVARRLSKSSYLGIARFGTRPTRDAAFHAFPRLIRTMKLAIGQNTLLPVSMEMLSAMEENGLDRRR